MALQAPFAPFRRMAYDRNRVSRIRRTTGLKPAQDCVAVYLIFQPKGVLPSTLRTCRFLNDNGFSVHLVSNAALSDTDRAALATVCTLVLERPNFGYDFGGYRDGILDILATGALPERLLVMNDSIWFPLFDDSDLLKQMRETPFDIFGPAIKVRPNKPHKDHICSFMFSYSNRLVRSCDFADYWQNLHMSDEKQAVIFRNEMKMTYKLSQCGFSYGALYDFEDVFPITRHPSLSHVDAYINAQQNGLQADTPKPIERDPAGISAAQPAGLGRTRETLARPVGQGPSSYDVVSVPKIQLPFLKKDHALRFSSQRRLLKAMPIFAKIDPVIRAEIAGWDGA